MALVQMNFESEYLQSNHEISVILPDKPRSLTPAQFYGSGKKYPVVWLLHGTFGAVSYTHLVGLTFSWNAIRERDMVTVGAFSADEVEEDIEISFAALEHRFPDLEKRSSPNTQQAAFGG